MARWSLVASVAVGLVVVLPACGGGGAPVLAGTPKVETAEPGQATCQVAKDPLNPLIVEWPGTSKVSLDSASQHGVVVVSYVGCVLKVLASCQAGGAYEMKPVTPVRDKVSIENETDLYARLPLGVASLKGELKTAQRLELEYVAVGQREVSKPPASLSGDCAGATHYVRSIVVGAYGLDAIGRALASASAEAGDIAGGGKRKEAIQHLRGSGDVAKCAARDKTTDCAAVLQLGLAPLSVSDGSVTSGGFGAGLGALTVVPTVREVTTLDSGATSLAKVDVALLRLLQDAKRADKSEVPMDQKAAAWAKLLGYSGDNPYKELAEKRRDDWTRAAEAEVRRREQVAKVCKQHETDSAKLAELLRLDDDVISQKQKAAYRAELAQVYAPYATALDECKRNAEAARLEDEARRREEQRKLEAQRRKEEEARLEEARKRKAEEDRIAALPRVCGRFQILEPGDKTERKHPSPSASSWRPVPTAPGLIRDTRTGRVWMRYMAQWRPREPEARAYCSEVGMRLPTKEEATAIAPAKLQNTPLCGEAWPEGWWTWTSTTAENGKVWQVTDTGHVAAQAVDGSDNGNGLIGALCVR